MEQKRSFCPFIEACPLYKQFKFDAGAKTIRLIYCEGDFEKCERRRLRLKGETPSPKLLPNGRMLP